MFEQKYGNNDSKISESDKILKIRKWNPKQYQ